MIKIDFPEPTDDAWVAWRKECDLKQAEHNTTVPRPKADSKLYGGQKERIYLHPDGPFHGKCAYCEESIVTNQHGDIDHYRPKGAVKDKRGKAVRITIQGAEQDHPGYYWLTYNWKNLLPTCQLCNQPNKRRVQGRTVGKRDHFPLADESKRAKASGEEVNEEPLLIHPVLEDPAKYLRMDSTGVFYAVDGEHGHGQACIDTFGLNFKGLADKRATVYKSTIDLMVSLTTLTLTAPNSEEARAKRERLERIEAGYEEFTAAARLAIQDARKRLEPLLRPILEA